MTFFPSRRSGDSTSNLVVNWIAIVITAPVWIPLYVRDVVIPNIRHRTTPPRNPEEGSS